MSACVGWRGPCPVNGEFHGCTRPDPHPGRHLCACEARSHTAVEQSEMTRTHTKRDPTYYYPKYLKRKRGLL